MSTLEVKTFIEDWCPTCQKVAPGLSNLENRYNTKLSWQNLNTDQHGGTYEVGAIPTVIFVKDGVEVERMVGERPAFLYEETILKYL